MKCVSSFYMTDTHTRLSRTGLRGEYGCGESQPNSWRVDDSQSRPISSLLHTHGYCLSVRQAQSTALFTASQCIGLNGEEHKVMDQIYTSESLWGRVLVPGLLRLFQPEERLKQPSHCQLLHPNQLQHQQSCHQSQNFSMSLHTWQTKHVTD